MLVINLMQCDKMHYVHDDAIRCDVHDDVTRFDVILRYDSRDVMIEM